MKRVIRKFVTMVGRDACFKGSSEICGYLFGFLDLFFSFQESDWCHGHYWPPTGYPWVWACVPAAVSAHKLSPSYPLEARGPTAGPVLAVVASGVEKPHGCWERRRCCSLTEPAVVLFPPCCHQPHWSKTPCEVIPPCGSNANWVISCHFFKWSVLCLKFLPYYHSLLPQSKTPGHVGWGPWEAGNIFSSVLCSHP